MGRFISIAYVVAKLKFFKVFLLIQNPLLSKILFDPAEILTRGSGQ